MSVGFHAGQAKLDVSGTVVLRCLGQRQLNKERCPEAAALCSKARLRTTSQALRASSPSRGASGEEEKFSAMPKPPLQGEVASRKR